MYAVVAGSSGLVGSALLGLLLERPDVKGVTALVRRRVHSPHEKLEELVVDFETLSTALQQRRASHVFCCLGTTMAKAGSQAAFRKVDHDYPLELARATRALGANAFLLVSALGANERSLVFYNRIKGETERDVRAVGIPTLHIARPSLLLGERQEKRAGEAVGALVAGALSTAMLGPLRKYRPIEGLTVARALSKLSGARESGVFVHESSDLATLGAG